jgi:hypothetical protein
MVGDKIIGKGIAYTLDEFGAAEGFDNWANFVKNAKYAAPCGQARRNTRWSELAGQGVCQHVHL